MAERAPIMDYGGLEIQTNSGKQEINIHRQILATLELRVKACTWACH